MALGVLVGYFMENTEKKSFIWFHLMVIFYFMMMEIILKNCFIMFYMFIHFRCNLTSAFLRLFGGSRYTISG
jgi:CBS domain containing-hemolysin-like protein